MANNEPTITKFITIDNLKRFKNRVYIDKQDALAAFQLNAVNSGITEQKVAIYDATAYKVDHNIPDTAVGYLVATHETTASEHTITLSIKNLNETVLDSTTITLPINSTITGASYIPANKVIQLTIVDSNGTRTINISLSNLATLTDLSEQKEELLGTIQDYKDDIDQAAEDHMASLENQLTEWGNTLEGKIDALKFELEEELGYSYETDDETTSTINYTPREMTDKAYTKPVTSVTINIPVTVAHGFEAGVTFKTGNDDCSFTLNNQSDMPVKMLFLGGTINTYSPSCNSTINLLIYNDGINTNIMIMEVQN